MTTRMNIGVHRSTADPTWRTPARLFAELDDEFDFTLDPCASSPIKGDIRWFSEHDQGLWQEWSGRVFINPPYGRAIVDWMAKVAMERERCEVIVALVPCRTDTAWWHDYAMLADEIRFVRGRLSFEGVEAQPGSHNAPFPSAILVYRNPCSDCLGQGCPVCFGGGRTASSPPVLPAANGTHSAHEPAE